MIRQGDVYKIGKLGKPHGVKGEVSFMFDDDVFDRTDADYLILDIDGILVPFFIDEYRFHGSETALVKFDGIDTQDEARELTGSDVFFLRELSSDGGESVSLAWIIGCKLIDASTGNTIGVIQSLDKSTINTLFEVSTNGGGTMLVPACEELITNVDKEKKEVKINIPDGLLGLN